MKESGTGRNWRVNWRFVVVIALLLALLLVLAFWSGELLRHPEPTVLTTRTVASIDSSR
jgi:hypothetical protein